MTKRGKHVNSSFRLILTGAGLLHTDVRSVPGTDAVIHVYIKLQTALTTYFLFSLLLLAWEIKFNNINLLLVAFSW